MACRICGNGVYGGYECPICWCDYCEEHYKEYVLESRGTHEIIDEICQLCGAEL